ncbi:MAG: L,D-transpeptidase [Tepidisphaeraceae bacterium]
MASRIAFVALAAVGLISGGVWYFRTPAQTAAAPKPAGALLPTEPGPQLPPKSTTPAKTAQVIGAIEQTQPDITATKANAPTTRPAQALSADQLFEKAQKLKERGDLLTARDLVNNAMVAGQIPESDLDSAKQFLAQLNTRILLSPEMYPNDPWNKSLKMEPGYAAAKFCKRFDITPELFGRINGIDSHKIRAGKTYKLIQGPFHLIVSKSKFTADVYLGAPGGQGSMYVKTFRVGLGSDDSTPLGTWQVGTGKLVNPVYYSPQGDGVIGADDPKNPLGERWIPLEGLDGDALGKQSYGIHGTIEPDSIGKNMSHGCIRLLNDDVTMLYDMLIENKSKVLVVP